MNAAQKKRLEEKNSKLIRELAALPSNRNCFECGQRGPTYVNITEGSFCCTQCSGILRGLNPPHRVKSISMAAFTTEEVEKVRSLGNAENAKIWLCLYDGVPSAMTNRDAVQAFLIKKYEKKTWYVSKEQLSLQEKALNEASREAASRASSHETASITSSSTATKPSELDLLSNDPFSLIPGSSQPTQTAPNQAFSPPAWMAPAPPFPFEEKPKPAPVTNGVDDLFGLLGPAQTPTFPMVQKQQQAPAQPTTQLQAIDPFADFDRKFNDLTVRPSNTISAFNGLSSLAPTNLPKSATIDSSMTGLLQPVSASNPFQMPPQSLQPMNMTPVAPTLPPQVPAQSKETSGGDKYSALAELDELFHHSGSSATDGKPAWVPTGFSTGLPPSQTTNSLQQNGTPRLVTNGFGGMPKSQTMGAIADYGVNNPFLTNAAGYSQAFPNPFGPPPTQTPMGYGMAPIVQPQQWNLSTNPQVPQRPAPSTTAPTPNWNPFL